MWVRLKTIYYTEVSGKLITKRPGDWIEVHKSEAMMLVARGQAEIPNYTEQAESLLVTDHAGLVVIGGEALPDAMLDQLAKLPVQNSDTPALYFQYNLIWTPSLPLRMELIPTGMHLLETWEMVVPMWDYNELAAAAGTDEDRAKVKAVVRDLRVPLYDTRLIFARRTESTIRFINEYNTERQTGMDDRLAFLLALYRVKPFLLPVPLTWTGRGG
jgi:hypothetical protein